MRKERQVPTRHRAAIEATVMAARVEPASSKYENTPSVSENSKEDWSWLDLGLNDMSSFAPENAINPDTGFSEADSNQSLLHSEANVLGIGCALAPQYTYFVQPELENWASNLDFICPPSIADLPPLSISADPPFRGVTNAYPSQSDTISEFAILEFQRHDSPTIEVKIAPPQTESDTWENSLDSSALTGSLGSKDTAEQYAPSIFGPGGNSSGASVLSVSSLRKRLSLRYSDSYLGDILSLMQNLTIAGSSAISTKRTTRSFNKRLSTTVTSHFETSQPLPSIMEMPSINEAKRNLSPRKKVHPVILPGIFPTCCWAQINDNNKLRRCRHGPLGLDGPLRGPSCRPAGSEKYRTIRSDVFFSILTNNLSSLVINEVDTFGNTGLHIAAACKPPKCLLALKEERHVYLNKVNNAGQTFLHLVHEPSSTNQGHLCALLEYLKKERFNFNRRDHHGQTVFHLLTRPWIPPKASNAIAQTLNTFNFHIRARDNLGYTVKEQFEQAGWGVGIISDLGTEEEKLSRTGSHCLPNFGENTAIETVEDLRFYSQHAELLRVIRISLSHPFHEDANGRNGLHCLAEVSLNLPIPQEFARLVTENASEVPQTQRERYLEGLLKSGVDINNHDKVGLTPLMAFVIHNRVGEDDALMTRLLQRLFEAGASINTRNRRGETALHLAVKLGRRAATKFLLGHGANVHARDCDGLGVIALGEASSKEAKHDETIYAQIILCISLVISAGGVSSPTILQEWGSPQWKICD
jgi:hypothetical protein